MKAGNAMTGTVASMASAAATTVNPAPATRVWPYPKGVGGGVAGSRTPPGGRPRPASGHWR
jgi:hypothetical protein